MAVDLALLLPLFAVAALLYASVGHGGATAYLAVFALSGYALSGVVTTVLALNVVVAGVAFAAYRRAGHLRGNLLLPFVVTSVPAAYVGGRFPLTAEAASWLLGATLAVAGVRLLAFEEPPRLDVPKTARLLWTLGPLLGALLGFVAGATGIGGGIFLSPVLLVLGWANVKESASVASAFIVLNSLAGLAAKVPAQGLDVGFAGPLAIAALAGGLVGASLGARRLRLRALQAVLGVVLLVAAARTLV